MAVYDAIVVGLGGVGSFALRSLAKQGKGGKFLGVERYSIGHSKGSSHGKTRIYRKAYFEHPNYVPWLAHSVAEFQQLQQDSKENIICECGSLVMEAKSIIENNPSLSVCQASWEAAQLHGIPAEQLSNDELQERFPQFNYQHEMIGVFEPGGGFVRPEKAIDACIQEAQNTNRGIEILEHSTVSSWSYSSSMSSNGQPYLDVILQINGEKEDLVLSTKSLIVAAGGWTGQLVPSWAPLLMPHRQLQGWLDTKGHPSFERSSMPCWVMFTPEYPLPLYGVPCDVDDKGGAASWIKIGIHGRDDFLADLSLNPSDVSSTERSELEAALAASIQRDAWRSSEPSNSPTLASAMPCFYTMTKDAHFLIGSPNTGVFSVAGLSGHGFKQAPALGRILADFVLGNDVDKWDLSFCSPNRFLPDP